MPHQTMPASEAEQLRRAHLTYPEVGQSTGPAPAGYHQLSHTVVVGTGTDRFREAATALLGWEMHRRASVSVRASSQSVSH